MFKKLFSKKVVLSADEANTPEVMEDSEPKHKELVGWSRFRSIMGLVGWILLAVALLDFYRYINAPLGTKFMRVFGF